VDTPISCHLRIYMRLVLALLQEIGKKLTRILTNHARSASSDSGSVFVETGSSDIANWKFWFQLASNALIFIESSRFLVL
jgi:hypothetical protein